MRRRFEFDRHISLSTSMGNVQPMLLRFSLSCDKASVIGVGCNRLDRNLQATTTATQDTDQRPISQPFQSVVQAGLPVARTAFDKAPPFLCHRYRFLDWMKSTIWICQIRLILHN